MKDGGFIMKSLQLIASVFMMFFMFGVCAVCKEAGNASALNMAMAGFFVAWVLSLVAAYRLILRR